MCRPMHKRVSECRMDQESVDEDLKARWMPLAVRYGAHPAVAEKLYQMIARAYAEPGRWYHTMRHIRSMIDAIEQSGMVIVEPVSLHFAVWFHDVIYDTYRGDNEERSADFAANILRALMVPEKIASRTASLILLTRHHAPPADDSDALLFLDADLLILGAVPERYQWYRQAIRREYSWVDEPHYRQARRSVLEEFLARACIYQTSWMYERYEEVARRNLSEEIAELSGTS